MGLILAFDPGKCTGLCCALHASGRDFKIVSSQEIQWDERFKIFNLFYINRTTITAIVIERYRLFSNALTLKSQIGSDIPSAQVIGIIELSAALCKLDCVYFQNPEDRKNVSVNPEHRSQLLRSRHAIDAYCHLKFHILTKARKQ
jgi:hypothetical protein